MRKIRLSDTDLELFDIEIGPTEYTFFQRHKDAFKTMFREQGKMFWKRFEITFRSFTVKHGVIKQLNIDSPKFQNLIDEAFIFMHEKFVEAKQGMAKSFIEDIARLAQNQDKFPELDSKSFARDPFFARETRELFRTFFGPPDQKASYLKVYILCPVYLRFGGSVCRCLIRWVEAPIMDDPSDDSYWIPPQPQAVDKTDTSEVTETVMCSKCIDECGTNYFREKIMGVRDGPISLPFWTFGDPRFNVPENPLFAPHLCANTDWRDMLNLELFRDFFNFARYTFGSESDKCSECQNLKKKKDNMLHVCRATKKKKKKPQPSEKDLLINDLTEVKQRIDYLESRGELENSDVTFDDLIEDKPRVQAAMAELDYPPPHAFIDAITKLKRKNKKKNKASYSTEDDASANGDSNTKVRHTDCSKAEERDDLNLATDDITGRNPEKSAKLEENHGEYANEKCEKEGNPDSDMEYEENEFIKGLKCFMELGRNASNCDIDIEETKAKADNGDGAEPESTGKDIEVKNNIEEESKESEIMNAASAMKEDVNADDQISKDSAKAEGHSGGAENRTNASEQNIEEAKVDGKELLEENNDTVKDLAETMSCEGNIEESDNAEKESECCAGDKGKVEEITDKVIDKLNENVDETGDAKLDDSDADRTDNKVEALNDQQKDVNKTSKDNGVNKQQRKSSEDDKDGRSSETAKLDEEIRSKSEASDNNNDDVEDTHKGENEEEEWCFTSETEEEKQLRLKEIAEENEGLYENVAEQNDDEDVRNSPNGNGDGIDNLANAKVYIRLKERSKKIKERLRREMSEGKYIHLVEPEPKVESKSNDQIEDENGQCGNSATGHDDTQKVTETNDKGRAKGKKSNASSKESSPAKEQHVKLKEKGKGKKKNKKAKVDELGIKSSDQLIAQNKRELQKAMFANKMAEEYARPNNGLNLDARAPECEGKKQFTLNLSGMSKNTKIIRVTNDMNETIRLQSSINDDGSTVEQLIIEKSCPEHVHRNQGIVHKKNCHLHPNNNRNPYACLCNDRPSDEHRHYAMTKLFGDLVESPTVGAEIATKLMGVGDEEEKIQLQNRCPIHSTVPHVCGAHNTFAENMLWGGDPVQPKQPKKRKSNKKMNIGAKVKEAIECQKEQLLKERAMTAKSSDVGQQRKSTSPGQMNGGSEQRKSRGGKVDQGVEKPEKEVALKKCGNCSKVEPSRKAFKKCQKCKEEGVLDVRYYCSRECQVDDWITRHKNEHLDGLLG